ncbi:murein hydrolase activator EnvC family protein [Microbacterium sp.]|uniref:murein hydrolase activator EnvC family protein n=2 Tax=Microbacterium sp. TaxID=51671 RepID=UPI003736C825
MYDAEKIGVAPLWARVVTPTCEVPCQCSNIAGFSPTLATADFSPRPPRIAHREPGVTEGSSMTTARALAAAFLATALAVASASAPDTEQPDVEWQWPLAEAVVVEPFAAPAHRYGPGHRGADLRPGGGDGAVRATADGVIAFEGAVAGRGVITIDHGDGLVTSVEPVTSTVSEGDIVARGDVIGHVSAGGHVAAGILHVGVRHHGEYVNPEGLVREIPRAVLLPCC